MTDVVIAPAARTAVGSFDGSFANTPSHELGAAAMKTALQRAGVPEAERCGLATLCIGGGMGVAPCMERD